MEATLRLPKLSYGWFDTFLDGRNRFKRHKQHKPTASSLTLAKFQPSPQIFGSPSHPNVAHNYNKPASHPANNYKREIYGKKKYTTTPGFQPKRRPQAIYSSLTPPPHSVVTQPQQLPQLPHHLHTFPTTLQLLTDFSSQKISPTVTIRPKRNKNTYS